MTAHGRAPNLNQTGAFLPKYRRARRPTAEQLSKLDVRGVIESDTRGKDFADYSWRNSGRVGLSCALGAKKSPERSRSVTDARESHSAAHSGYEVKPQHVNTSASPAGRDSLVSPCADPAAQRLLLRVAQRVGRAGSRRRARKDRGPAPVVPFQAPNFDRCNFVDRTSYRDT